MIDLRRKVDTSSQSKDRDTWIYLERGEGEKARQDYQSSVEFIKSRAIVWCALHGSKLLSVGHGILWPAPLRRWPSYIKRRTAQARVLIYCTQTRASNKRYGEHPKDSSCHSLRVRAHTLLWRESFQVADGMFISESLCVCTKDIWHHQLAQLSALTFSKDKERAREQKGDASEIEQNTNDTFSRQQHAESTGAFRAKGFACVCGFS